MSGYDYSHQHEQASFGDALVEQLKNAPWFLISLAIHAVIAIILHFVSMAPTPQPKEETVIEVENEEIPEELPEEPIVEEETEEVEPEEEPTEEPVVKETEVADHNETDNNEEFEESKGEDDLISDKPFDGTQTNDAIGFGGGAGGAFGGRRGGKRNLKTGGGGGRTEIAVERGLEWLAKHQSPDGSWDADNYMQNGDPAKGPLCEGKGRATNDVGVTGLALLCFFGAGHDHRTGPYKETVKKGLQWLKEQQKADGSLVSMGGSESIYNHACGALALAEGYAMSRSPLWKGPAQAAVDFVMSAQNYQRAWRYGVRPGEDDVSVTGWMIMVLKSAKEAGLNINDASLEWALAFIDEMTDQETGRTGYMKQGEPPVRHQGLIEKFPASESESLTGVAILGRVFAGQDPTKTDVIMKGAELMSRRLPVWEAETGKVDMYYWYYGTLAMFQVGGTHWTTWNERLKKAVIETQRGDGNYLGSWDPVGPWGEDGGRVYSTALMTLCMEVYYRYGRVFGAR